MCPDSTCALETYNNSLPGPIKQEKILLKVNSFDLHMHDSLKRAITLLFLSCTILSMGISVCVHLCI